jgi:hypothetical protein
MNKSGTLITSALLTFGIAAAAMAANSPQATATMAADTTQAPSAPTTTHAPSAPTTTQAPSAPTIGPKEDQRAIDTAPPKSAGKSTTHKHKKKHKPVTPAPKTTN